MKAPKNKILVYTHQVKAERQEDGSIKWTPSEEAIDKMTLGVGWKMPVTIYSRRNNFYCGFEIKGDSDIFPILEAKLELDVPSLTEPEFVLEIACTPSKLDPEHKKAVIQLVESYLDDDNFKAWWDDDKKGPDRKISKNKQRVLRILKEKMPTYEAEDDLTPDKCVITVNEALEYLEINSKEKPSEDEFRSQLRKMQLKLHPDRNGGAEDSFKKLQKCKVIVEEALFSN